MSPLCIKYSKQYTKDEPTVALHLHVEQDSINSECEEGIGG